MFTFPNAHFILINYSKVAAAAYHGGLFKFSSYFFSFSSLTLGPFLVEFLDEFL